MTWLRYLGIGVAALLLFGAGYKYASALYESDIAELQKNHALAVKELTNEYRKQEQAQAQRLAQAWDELEKARTESVDLRHDVERVRQLADGYRARLSAAGASACKPCKAELGKCVRLLSEGAGLAGEGADLSVRIAADKDTLARLR